MVFSAMFAFVHQYQPLKGGLWNLVLECEIQLRRELSAYAPLMGRQRSDDIGWLL